MYGDREFSHLYPNQTLPYSWGPGCLAGGRAVRDNTIASRRLNYVDFLDYNAGAPLDITPLQDNVDLAKDPQRNNKFDYSTVITLYHIQMLI